MPGRSRQGRRRRVRGAVPRGAAGVGCAHAARGRPLPGRHPHPHAPVRAVLAILTAGWRLPWNVCWHARPTRMFTMARAFSVAQMATAPSTACALSGHPRVGPVVVLCEADPSVRGHRPRDGHVRGADCRCAAVCRACWQRRDCRRLLFSALRCYSTALLPAVGPGCRHSLQDRHRARAGTGHPAFIALGPCWAH